MVCVGAVEFPLAEYCNILIVYRTVHVTEPFGCYSFLLTLRLLMSYIYGAPILDVSRSHTTTQHSR